MQSGPVHGPAIASPILLVGQAPGLHEERLGRPFAYTAGKTLFKWLEGATGADEETIRELVYFAAVARCFPGKAKSGDRPPSREEMANCRPHLAAEVRELKPRLVLAVGKIAIAEIFGVRDPKLSEYVGRSFRVRFHDQLVNVIPLPHPSGVSRWPHSSEGKVKLAAALALVTQEFARLL